MPALEADIRADIRPPKPSDRSSMEAVIDAAYRVHVRLVGGEPGPMLDDYGAPIPP